MKKLLFIGLEFHQRTRSADFFLEMLQKTFSVTTCYVDWDIDEPYGIFSTVNESKFDVLVCWQVMPPVRLLKKYFTCRHAALFPMLDGVPPVKKAEKWYPFRKFQIICFSKTLSINLARAGFSSHHIQYFPELVLTDNIGAEKDAFFWSRQENITVRLIEMLCSKLDLQRIHLHKVPDPGCQVILPEEDSPVHYTFSDWYDTREEMRRDIASCALYIAPRDTEGIGMSFLEAMAMGRCVIAPDRPTMNEYIEHGKTGLLYDLNDPMPLEPYDIRKIQKQTRVFMEKGRSLWDKDKHKIAEWLVTPAIPSRGRLFRSIFIRFLRSPGAMIRVLIRERRS